MIFNKLDLEPDDCNCLKGTFEDTSNLYSYRIKQPIATTESFETKWEKGQGQNEFDCEKLCNRFKSLSINLWSSREINKKIIEKYITIFTTRQGEDAALVFKFLPNSGLLKLYNEEDPTHYGFFKSDDFATGYLIISEIIILAETNLYKELEQKRNEKRK